MVHSKHLVLFLLLITFCCINFHSKAQTLELMRLERFIKANPRTVDVNILTEGTMGHICANDSCILIQISVGNPLLFMRMLMQGLTLYIDPTGGKKKKYEVRFPSAQDVRGVMNDIQDIPAPESNQRPDIGPLLHEMNAIGGFFTINGRTQPTNEISSFIELDADNEKMFFYVMLPTSQMMTERKLSSTWRLGLHLDRPERHIQETGFHPSENRNMESMMVRSVSAWAKFSIDDAMSVNL